MHLIDLAGSERINMSGAEGESLIETQNINLSLTTLGDVLSALSKNAALSNKTSSYNSKGSLYSAPPPNLVPYRNSKLTFLLKDSLGGNSRTIMITTVSSLSEYYQQTAVSLMYSARAKKVTNRSLVNSNVIGDTGIHNITGEIDRLNLRLEERTLEYERLKLSQMRDAEENNNLKFKLNALSNTNDVERKQLEKQMSSVIHSHAGQLASHKDRITFLQRSLRDELSVSQDKIIEQEREIELLKTSIEKKPIISKEEMEKLQIQLDDKSKETISANSMKKRLGEEVLNKNKEIQLLTSKLVISGESVEAKISECNDLNNRLELAEESHNQLHSEIIAIQNKFSSLETDYSIINAKFINQESDSMMYKSQAEAKYKSLEREKSNEMKSFDLKIIKFEKEKSILLQKLKKSSDDTESRLSLAVEELSKQLNQAESKGLEFSKRSKISDTEIKTLKKNLSISETKNNNLELKLQSVEANSAIYKGKNVELKELLKSQKHLSKDSFFKSENQVKMLSEALIRSEGELSSRTEALSIQKDEDSNQITTLKTELVELKESNEIKINEIREHYLKEEKTIQEASQIALTQLQHKLTNAHNNQIESLKANYLKKEDNFRNHLEGIEKSLKVRIDTEIESGLVSMRDNHANKINKMELESNNRIAIAILEEKESCNSKINKLKNEHNISLNNLKNELDILGNEKLLALENKYILQISNQEKENIQKITEINKENKNLIQSMEEQFHNELTQHKNEKSKIISDNIELISSYKLEIQSCKDNNNKNEKILRNENIELEKHQKVRIIFI
jgi:hypothetical protein